MKIAAIMGSPKGEESVTRAYVRYLQTSFPEHEWAVEHVARRIPLLEKRGEVFSAIMDSIRDSDAVPQLVLRRHVRS